MACSFPNSSPKGTVFDLAYQTSKEQMAKWGAIHVYVVSSFPLSLCVRCTVYVIKYKCIYIFIKLIWLDLGFTTWFPNLTPDQSCWGQEWRPWTSRASLGLCRFPAVSWQSRQSSSRDTGAEWLGTSCRNSWWRYPIKSTSIQLISR